MNKNNLAVDREKLVITMSRVLEAPREVVWRVVTDPELIPSWWGPRHLTTVVDKMDVRVGGAWRYIQTDPDGNEHAFNGIFTELVPPERMVQTFEYEPMAGHITTDVYVLEALPDGRTKLTATSTFNSLEELEGMLQSGMEGGAVETWDRLEELLIEVGQTA